MAEELRKTIHEIKVASIEEKCKSRIIELETRLETCMAEKRVVERLVKTAERLIEEIKALRDAEPYASIKTVENLLDKLKKLVEKSWILSKAILVYYRLPHEESRQMGARLSIEKDGGIIRLVKEYDAEKANIAKNLRKTVAQELSSKCVKIDDGVYLCPPSEKEELEKLAQNVRDKYRKINPDITPVFNMVPVLMAPTDLYEIILNEIRKTEEALEEVKTKIEEYREEGKRTTHLARKIAMLETKLSVLKKWAAELNREES